MRGVFGVVLLALVGCADEGKDAGAGDGTGLATETDALGETDEDTFVVPPQATEIEDVVLPLGETLFLTGDDLLAPWGVGDPDRVTLVSAPTDAQATIADGRLTPDVVGTWVIALGDDEATIDVRDDTLDADTFLNLNYSPTAPLLAWDDTTAWVASPPSNAVQRLTVGEGTLTAGPLIPTGGWPTALARWGDRLLVSQTGRDSLGVVDPALGRVVDALPVGDEPGGLVVVDDAAWVALAGPGQLVRVDLLTGEVTDRVDVGREPKAVAHDPVRGRLYVASQLSSNAHPQALSGETSDVPQPDVWIVDVETRAVVGTFDDVGTILRGLLVDGDRLLVACSESHNDRRAVDADSHPHEHRLVSIDLDTGDQEVHTPGTPGRTTAFANPFSMARVGDDLYVTAAASQVVGRFDPVTLEALGRVEVGHDPRGLVAVGDRLLVYPWLDEAVVSLDGLTVDAEAAVGRDPTPDDVREGQRIFNDGAFSRYGEFSCNNCHIDGVVDGLTWDLLLDGEVNTLPFRNIGGTGPFLWGGFLPTLFDFSREVLRLVGADASGEDMALLNAYMQSVTAPPNPHTAPGGRLTEAGRRGQAVFEGAAGCAACHDGPLFTNRSVVRGKTHDLQTDVPTLVGVYDSAPYGREGDWTTLGAMIDRAVAYTEATLTPAERDDLLAYVQQIPGDLLYVNGALPLDGSPHVWVGSPVEVQFSDVLAPGQADRFVFQHDDGSGWAGVDGDWVVSGRFARFDPADGDLVPERDYRVRVKAGVVGALGTRLVEPLELRFSTGALPGTDVSGIWHITVPGQGSLDMGFIQARGGQVTGARVDSGGPIDFDNVRGHVAGTTFYMEPFLAEVAGFDVEVSRLDVDLVDTDGDGFADEGTGRIETPFLDLDAVFERVSLPE